MVWEWCLRVIIAAYFIFILVRTIRFKPKPEQDIVSEPVALDGSSAERLARMVRVKTVSSREGHQDEAAFRAFRALLPELYPAVHRHLAITREEIGPSGLLYRWKGKSSDNPAVLMSHYDVVPADEAAWSRPPFAGIIEEDVLWGRGTLDTKATLCGILEAAEALLKEDFVPKNDVYFAFSGDEEVMGPSAPAIVKELARRGIKPAFVLDEGGAVVGNIFPGVNRPSALIGVAEKGLMDVRLSVKSAGGHASAPPRQTPVGILAKAVTRIEAKPFPGRLSEPAARMFDTLGRHSSFTYRMIFANLWCFFPLLNALCKKRGGELNALVRTTCAFTTMSASKAQNVLPPLASVGANLRLIGGDTPDTAIERLKKTARDERITFEKLYGMNPSPVSPSSGEAWERLERAVRQTWPEALVSPYLMLACSDSRHYPAISAHVYRFSAMALTKEERESIHGNDERIPVIKIERTAQFYTRLIRMC